MTQEYLPAPPNVRLADLMKEHNINQPELAKEIGCSTNINITMAETSSDMLIEMLKNNELDFTFSCDEDVVQELSLIHI